MSKKNCQAESLLTMMLQPMNPERLDGNSLEIGVRNGREISM